MMSATEIIFKLCSFAKLNTSSPLFTVPSSFISSDNKPTGGKPPNFAKSLAASVCPDRIKTPPSLAIRGNT